MRLLFIAALLAWFSTAARAQDVIVEPAVPAAVPGDDGWGGAQPDRLRGLPDCDVHALPPPPGGAYTCRPYRYRGPVQWSLDVDWTSGVVTGPDALLGGTSGLGVALGFALTRWLTVGPRYQLLGFGRGTPPGAGESASAVVANDLLAQARLRGFTDEVDRDAWALSAAAGYSFRSTALGSGPIARLAIAREGGLYVTAHGAMTTALELAYEQAFDDSDLRMVTASVRGGFEVGIRTPRNVEEPEPGPPFRYSVAGEFRAGTLFGFGLTVGTPMTDQAFLRLTVDHSFGRDGATLQGFDGASWGALGGVRLMPFGSVAFPYLDLQGGWDFTAAEGDAGRPPGGAGRGDVEVGVRLASFCGAAVDVGARIRTRMGSDGVEPRDGALVLRFELGHGARALGWRTPGGCGRSVPTRPQPVLPSNLGVRGVDGTGAGNAEGAVEGTVGGTVEGTVETGIEVRIEPVVIEVELGAVLFGGAIEVRIDPRSLPLDRLRAAGFVEVELTGPAAGLARFDAELRGVLSRQGLTVHGWTQTATDARVVRARFTIWPPGSRPR
ncbi:MAG TPA: hypothetical protein VML75_21855 [Kofleriaceae bacterium]|nr:hypothetical protein [Kofleriaceae bacterium]